MAARPRGRTGGGVGTNQYQVRGRARARADGARVDRFTSTALIDTDVDPGLELWLGVVDAHKHALDELAPFATRLDELDRLQDERLAAGDFIDDIVDERERVLDGMLARFGGFGAVLDSEIDRRWAQVVDEQLDEMADDLSIPGITDPTVVRAVVREHLVSGADVDALAAAAGIDEDQLRFVRGAAWLATERLGPGAFERVTTGTIGDLVDLGGSLEGTVYARARGAVKAVAGRLPAAWLADANANPVPLAVLPLGDLDRAQHVRDGQVKVRKIDRAPMSGRFYGTFAPGLDAAGVEAVLRRQYPEAFDPALYERKGHLKPSRRDPVDRVHTIGPVTYNPATGDLSCEISYDRASIVETVEAARVVNAETDEPTMAHELGHDLEATVPHVRRLAHRWREHRATGVQVTQIADHPTGEVGYDAGFVHHYVGKVYARGETEVVSTGLEGVYYGRYGSLAGRGWKRGADHSHRAFMLGLLTLHRQSKHRR